MRKIAIAGALALAGTSLAVPAAAQVNVPVQGGLVNVAIGDVTVLNGFLNDVEITALNNLLNNNQVIVQVPIGVAANVCNIAANVLAQGGGLTDGKCTAEAGSQALAQAVRKQKLNK